MSEPEGFRGTKGKWRLGTAGKSWAYHLNIASPGAGWFLEISMGYPKEEMAYPEEAEAEFEANATPSPGEEVERADFAPLTCSKCGNDTFRVRCHSAAL